MNLLIFRSLWTNGADLDAALTDCQSGVFDGIEGPAGNGEFAKKLQDAGVPFIAEITSGGSYVPDRGVSLQDHLDSFTRKLERSMACNPLLVTVLGGSDSWPLQKNVEFFGRALEIGQAFEIALSFETHRSRATFNPWATRDLLDQLPDLYLTCDFSHWCCVCERLVMDDDPELLTKIAKRARHIHGRVGYDQGPQVPHPAAPEYLESLEAHERWWDAIWTAQEESGVGISTLTPEFGPDGYLHTVPFSGQAVADLDEINHWMALRQRERFALRTPSSLICL